MSSPTAPPPRAERAAPMPAPPAPAEPAVKDGGRLASLDAYRGLIMMALSLQGYFPGLATGFPDNRFIQALGRQFEHVPWQGGVFWDTIQPAFMFMVGVAMTYSFHSRRARGESYARIAGHVARRTVVLVLLGVFLASVHSERTQWMFGEVLCQIGLAFPLAFLLIGRGVRTQLLAGAGILAATWLAFALYPLPAPSFDYAALGVADPGPWTGFFAHWNNYTNVAYAFDRWFLNLFPRDGRFLGNYHYGPTLNFIPSAVTLLYGVMAAELLRSVRPAGERLRILGVAGAGSLAAGLLMGATICPIIKAIWTPSYVLASGGLVLWSLALAYWGVDLRGWQRPAFPFVVVGRNSLAMYLMLRLLKEPVRLMVNTHAFPLHDIGHYWTFEFYAVVLILWLICYWLYRRRIFISI